MSTDVFSACYEEIAQQAYEVLERIKPRLMALVRKFIARDRINDEGDYYNTCFELACMAIMSYRTEYNSKKLNRKAARWKRKNGKSQNHRMSLDNYVFDYILKKIFSDPRLIARIEKGGHVEFVDYQKFCKNIKYYKAAGYKIDFFPPEIPVSYLSNNEDDEDLDIDTLLSNNKLLDPYNMHDDLIEVE